jgi:PEP-CTERM motif-containing protein
LDGNKTVVETVAPLGQALLYVSGGDGLLGTSTAYPTAPNTPGNRALYMSGYDHRWMQFDPPILVASFTASNRVFAIPGVDHGPSPGENLEFIIWGADSSGNKLEEGHIVSIYRDGFDTANTTLGHSDDYTSLWGFKNEYQFFLITSGDHLTGHFSPGEGEIDALAFAQSVPEPSTYALLTLGLGVAGWQVRRRRNENG